jgi:sortase (surface protein transpeptidase)
VARTDTSVVQPQPAPTLTLMTCTGLWLPGIADYAERIVVRAELAS